MAFQNDLKKIDHRNWCEISSKWLAYLPTIIPPGRPPAEEICDFPDITTLAGEVSKMPGLQMKKEVSYFRSEIFSEGIYLFHKAANVIGNGLIHVENGVLSWSISSAYHSSFFSLKALLCLLGLSFPRVKSLKKCLMIDCFPEPEKLSSKQIKNKYLPPPELKFVLTDDLGHGHYWEILERILNVTTVSFWNKESIECLRNFDADDYAYQRNNIHYINNHWLIPDDLFTRKLDLDFAYFKDINSVKETIGKETADFSFFTSYILLQLTYSLIKDISQKAPILLTELNLIDNYLMATSNIRMNKSIIF